MASLLFAAVFLVVALAIQLGMLWKRQPKMRKIEQAFHFHELRDQLQLLVMEDKLCPASRTHSVLMPALNLCIRNAGNMSLTEMLEIAAAFDSGMSHGKFEEFTKDLKQHGPEVQEVASQFFTGFATMLIANDPALKLLYRVFKSLAGVVYLRYVKRAMHSVTVFVMPEREQAFKTARKFEDWGSMMSPSFGG